MHIDSRTTPIAHSSPPTTLQQLRITPSPPSPPAIPANLPYSSWHRGDATAIKIVGKIVEWILRIIRWTWRPILALGVLVCGGYAAQSLCSAAHERKRAAYSSLPWDEEHALTPRSASPRSPSPGAGEKRW